MLLACGTIAVTATAALGQGGLRQESDLRLTATQPRSPSGYTLEIDYVNPDDPAAKPPAVRRVLVRLPRGTRIDTSVPPRCNAPDAQLMAQGPAACPAGSVIGSAVITIDTGFPGPSRFITSDTTLLNNTDELIFLNTVRGTGARVVTRTEVTRRTTITEAPPLPGTPPDGGAIDTVDLEIQRLTRVVDGERRSYITTPRRCGPSGWLHRVSFTYPDGVTQTVRTISPCAR